MSVQCETLARQEAGAAADNGWNTHSTGHDVTPAMTDIAFANDPRGFDYVERQAMKIQLPELMELQASGQAQVTISAYPRNTPPGRRA
ncbi:hypothetical protein Thiowin_02021 [Thiorhodovibrio winogradskyi]|uniref:Uncharacterized protein n=1 Tax=Thiorhodovibrio winogradskyi TaxID=77007 RepID=A0ABZ0SBQ9_9GAMM|nr:hypothetical protein [Thiorhodovibrio winogradskyi]